MRLTFSCLALLLALGGPVAAGVSYESTAPIDPRRYATYSWSPGGPASHQETERRIRSAVDEELVALGFIVVTEGGAVEVSTYALADKHTLAQLSSADYWDFWTGVTNVSAKDVQAGTLVIDMREPDDGRLVWRGLARGSVSYQRERTDQKVDRIVGRIVRGLTAP